MPRFLMRFATGPARARLVPGRAPAKLADGGALAGKVDGKLVENLHVENARRLVALAEAIEALEAESASN